MSIIQFNDVWEMYRIKFVTGGRASWDNFWALKGASFSIAAQEAVGIIGENGAGKTTVLKLIAGLIKPDRGEVRVSGRVSGLLELGAGFQLELTGRENMYLSLSLFGLDQRKSDEICEQIIHFADIGRFIDAPVKCYSQGMFVRLAFSIAIHVDPEILLIDDILAVGDEYFQRKCIKKIFELRDSGTTIICVTHDMGILRRLCKRVIFLKEGRVIKDDSPDKVIPLYAQMIGVKEAVANLTRGSLSVVFNNGRIFLNWQDKPITAPDSGAYTELRVQDKIYHSFRAAWEVKRESETKIVAYGRLDQLALTQVWRLEVTDNSELKWDVEIQTDEPVELQEGHIKFMARSEYTDWFSSFERGGFPVIDGNSRNWQSLIEESVFDKRIGIRCGASADSGLPALVFEHTDTVQKIQAQVLNSDYITNSRVLQYKVFGAQNSYSDQATRFLWFSGKLVLGIADIDQYLDDVQNSIGVSFNKTKLIINNGRGDIIFGEKGLSGPSHFSSAFSMNGRKYLSNCARGEVRKENNKLIARFIWKDLPIVQTWEAEALGETAFRLRVTMQVSQEVCIDQQTVSFVFPKEYCSWLNGDTEQGFPTEFLEYEVDMTHGCIQRSEIGVVSRIHDVPTVALKLSEANNFAKVFSSDFFAKSRSIRVYKIEPEGQNIFLPGEHLCFDIDVSFAQDKPVINRRTANSIKCGELSLIFDRGAGRIYWKGKEITKNLGLYTSVRSQGRWHDSASSAVWQIESIDERTIKVRGEWRWLPLSQFWEIALADDNSIEWRVGMVTSKEIEVDRMQTNVMLSELYDEWSANGIKGALPSFKENIGEDWEVIYSKENSDVSKENELAVSASANGQAGLPSVRALSCQQSAAKIINIINSDLYHRGRVLQYLRKGTETLRPQEKINFAARIAIQ